MQNTGTVSLFLLPAVFLHFFLVFPRPKQLPLRQAGRVDGRAAGALEGLAAGLPLGEPGALLPALRDSAASSSSTTSSGRCAARRVSVLSGAPLSSWVLLGDYLVLGLVALAHSAFTLQDARERRQAFHVFVGTILGTAPFVLLGIVLPSAFQIDEYVFYGIVPMILIPLTFAYAIVRFQMLNIRVRRAADVPLRGDDGDPLRLLRARDRAGEPRLRGLAALGLADLQLRLLPRRHPALRVPPPRGSRRRSTSCSSARSSTTRRRCSR